MADNIAITAGSGTTVATDDVAGVHFQRVKLVDGTLDGTGAIGGDATNGLDVDVTRLPALPAGTNNIGDVDVLTVPAPLSTSGGGTEATALRVTLASDSTGLVSVDDNGGSLTVDAPVGTPVFVRLSDGSAAIGTLPVSLASVPSHAVTNAGTFATQAAGDVAHDGADSGAPVKVGARAVTSLAGATMVAAADRTDAVADLDGAQIVKPLAPFGDILVERVSDTGGTSTASTVFGATASARNYITTIAAYNDSSTGGYVDFRDGTAGTILFTLPLPAKGGAVANFPLPLRQSTVNTAWAYDVSAALSTVYLSFIGFKSKA